MGVMVAWSEAHALCSQRSKSIAPSRPNFRQMMGNVKLQEGQERDCSVSIALGGMLSSLNARV